MKIITCFSLLIVFLGCHIDKSNQDIYSELYIDTIIISKNIYEIYTMREDKPHGVSWVGDINSPYPNFKTEALFIDGKSLLDKVFYASNIEYGHEIFYYADTVELITGSWVYDRETNELKVKRTAYYNVLAPDTILYGEPYEMKIIAVLGLVEDFDIRLQLGEITPDVIFISPVTEYIGTNKALELTITDYKKGINLITGKISFHSELLDNELHFLGPFERNTLIFYHQFYVQCSD
jgi:hypothetical protein